MQLSGFKFHPYLKVHIVKEGSSSKKPFSKQKGLPEEEDELS
jgi:hypothetical protein